MAQYVPESDGVRIRRLRRRAGLTQAGLGARIGRTQPWVSMLESDRLVLDSVGLLNTVARELRVSPDELTGKPYRFGRTPAQDRGHAAITDIRRQLQRFDLAPEWDGLVRSTDELAASATELTTLRQRAGYVALAERAPAMLAELQAACHERRGTDRERCFALLAAVYRETDAAAYGLGYSDLSILATDRMRWAAERSGDEYTLALGDYLRVRELWSTASWDDALSVIDRTLARLDDAYIDGDWRALIVWGALQMRAAITSARKLDADDAYGRMALAHEAVDRLGDRGRLDPYTLVVTPANVAVHDVAVAIELGDPVEAVKRGATLELPPDLPRSRAGHHHMDMSRGWLWSGDRDRSLAAMEQAERLTPLLVRNHPMAQKTVRALLDAERRGYRERVRRLGARVGVL